MKLRPKLGIDTLNTGKQVRYQFCSGQQGREGLAICASWFSQVLYLEAVESKLKTLVWTNQGSYRFGTHCPMIRQGGVQSRSKHCSCDQKYLTPKAVISELQFLACWTVLSIVVDCQTTDVRWVQDEALSSRHRSSGHKSMRYRCHCLPRKQLDWNSGLASSWINLFYMKSILFQSFPQRRASV